MKLDSEQKKVLKAALLAFSGFLVGYPFSLRMIKFAFVSSSDHYE